MDLVWPHACQSDTEAKIHERNSIGGRHGHGDLNDPDPDWDAECFLVAWNHGDEEISKMRNGTMKA